MSARPPIAPASIAVSRRVETPAASPRPRLAISSGTLATIVAAAFALMSSALSLLPDTSQAAHALSPAALGLRGTLAFNADPSLDAGP